jgi:hypothetical protein
VHERAIATAQLQQVAARAPTSVGFVQFVRERPDVVNETAERDAEAADPRKHVRDPIWHRSPVGSTVVIGLSHRPRGEVDLQQQLREV